MVNPEIICFVLMASALFICAPILIYFDQYDNATNPERTRVIKVISAAMTSGILVVLCSAFIWLLTSA